MRSLAFHVLAILACLAAYASPAAAHGKQRIVWDDFKHGFTVDSPDARWLHFGAGTFVADDGIPWTSCHGGLWVSASGYNPLTHAPAFVKTMSWADGPLSAFDHVKWLAIMNHEASSGLVGFDAVPGRELSCTAVMSGQIFGAHRHPFGNAVTDPGADPRLGAVAMSAFDPETFVIFNFLLTNTRIFAFYERAPFARDVYGDYASFLYAIPVAARWPWQEHELSIAYDKAGGKVRWIVDGEEVFRVQTIGARIAPEHMLLDRGGEDVIISPDQLDCGMGTFTFLDGYGPTDRGLVQIDADAASYVHPLDGEPYPMSFVDPTDAPESRLFGQGALMHVERYVVESRKLP
jgi:hypothetical protein